jgi:mannose-6-phosphate isomerase-like protein (cupin superfamily)
VREIPARSAACSTVGVTPSPSSSRTAAISALRVRAFCSGGALGLVEGSFYEGFGPPLHVHHREDEAFYVLEGEIRFRQADDEFVAGPGTWVWGPREVPHAFKVQPGGARALVFIVPAGLERMFEEGGVPARESAEPPTDEYDPAAAVALAERFGFEVVGPQLYERRLAERFSPRSRGGGGFGPP